jgi:hypothetical protein
MSRFQPEDRASICRHSQWAFCAVTHLVGGVTFAEAVRNPPSVPSLRLLQS